MNIRRWFTLLLGALLAITVASPAQAKPYRGSSPTQIMTDKDLPQFVKDAADAIVLSEYGTTGVVRDSMLFLSVYAPGDIKHLPKFAEAIADAFLRRGSDVCDYDNIGVGCSSIMRGDPDITLGRPRVNDRDNTSYALYRPLQLSQKLGYRFKPVAQVIEGFPPARPSEIQTGQGVLLIRVFKVPVAYTRPAKDTLTVLQEQRSDAFAIGPTIGVVYVNVDGNDFLSPSIGIVIRHDNVMLFMSDGRTFEETRREEGRDDRLRYGGIRFSQPTGLYWGFTYLDARRLMVEYDQYTHRAVGGTITGGYQRAGAHLYGNLGVGLGLFNLVTPAKIDADWKPGFAAMASVGLTF